MPVKINDLYAKFDNNETQFNPPPHNSPSGNAAPQRAQIWTHDYNDAKSAPDTITDYDTLKAIADRKGAGSTDITDTGGTSGLLANDIKITDFSFVRNTSNFEPEAGNFLTKMHSINHHFASDQAVINNQQNLFIGEAGLNNAHSKAAEDIAKNPVYRHGWLYKQDTEKKTLKASLCPTAAAKTNFLIKDPRHLWCGVTNKTSPLTISKDYYGNEGKILDDKKINGKMYKKAAVINRNKFKEATLLDYTTIVSYNLPNKYNEIKAGILDCINDSCIDLEDGDINTVAIEGLLKLPDSDLKKLYPSSLQTHVIRYTPDILKAGLWKIKTSDLKWIKKDDGPKELEVIEHSALVKLDIKNSAKTGYITTEVRIPYC
jgi:hypothetical protein